MTAPTDYPDRWRRAVGAPTQNATSEAVVLAVDSYVAALTPDQFDQLVAPHPRPLMINIAMIGARHAKALLTATTDCEGTSPKALSDLVDSLGAVAKAATITDPTNDLINAVLAGTLRGDELDERIAQAARPGNRRIPYAGLRQRAELAVMKEFVNALQDGAAGQIIDSLRPQFDAATKALIGCGEIVDLNTDAETTSPAPTKPAARRGRPSTHSSTC
jgi:hypothetical protein